MKSDQQKSQFHTTPALKQDAEQFHIPVLEFDGIAEVWVDSLEDWKEIVTDPDFVKYIAGKSASATTWQTWLLTRGS